MYEIKHIGSRTYLDTVMTFVGSPSFSWVTADATLTANGDNIEVEVGGNLIKTIPVSDIVLIDGVEPAGNTTDVIAQIEDSGGGGGSASYQVYTALLTQTGTDAPVCKCPDA